MTSARTLGERSRGCRPRELTGQDELSVERTDSSAAIALLGRLTGGEPDASHLTAFERDRLLAAVYTRNYGQRIDSTLDCAACSKPFDISFSLDDLLRRAMPATTATRPARLLDNPEASNPGAPTSAADGTYRTADGVRFRLPTGEDELSVLHLTNEEALGELLRRCVLEAPEGFDAVRVQDEMERVAPILDVDINTSCPECGAAARLRFDLQSYVLQSIVQDRRRLWRETHLLASTYKWSLGEILGLSRADRRTLAGLIESAAARGALS